DLVARGLLDPGPPAPSRVDHGESAGEELSAQSHGAVSIGGDLVLVGLSVTPRRADRVATTRSKSVHGAVRPLRWQRRQQVHLAGMTLEQHLRDTAGGPEVAVDLKRRVK